MQSIQRIAAALLLGTGLGAIPAAAGAAPSYLGPSGYILTPDATVAPGGCANLGYHYFNPDRGVDFSTLAGNYGIADRFEVGLTGFNVHHSRGGDGVWLNAKASLLKQDQPFQLAGGVIDAFDDTDRGAYVVGSINVGEQFASELLPRTLRVGAGLGTGNFIDGIFVNGGFVLGPVQLLGEWIDDPSLVNLGARYQQGGLTLDFAGMDLTGRAFPAFGASYTHCFGGRRPSGGEDDGKGYEEEKGYPGKG